MEVNNVIVEEIMSKLSFQLVKKLFLDELILIISLDLI
jgi:hypothetical protein